MSRELFRPPIHSHEWQQIHDVICRDGELRQKEMLRLRKIEDQLKEEHEGAAHQLASSAKCCFRCGSTFNFLFRKKNVCSHCKRLVCRRCATWSTSTKASICLFCDKLRILQSQTNFFASPSSSRRLSSPLPNLESDTELESDSGYDPTTHSLCSRQSSLRSRQPFCGLFASKSQQEIPSYIRATPPDQRDNIPPDPRSEDIREHIETLVERIIDQKLENAKLQRVYEHPEYDRMLSTYQGRLSEALTQLGFSLHMSIANQPLSENLTPSCAHIRLKEIVDEVLEEVANLPYMEERKDMNDHLLNIDNEWTESMYSQSYEDILATAVLNKVIEQHQKKNYNISKQQNGEVPTKNSKEIQTDEFSTSGVQSGANDDESGSDAGTESAGDDFSWAGKNSFQPVSYTIEEKIEEITTTIEDTESETETKSQHPVPAPRRAASEPLVTRTTSRNIGFSSMDYLYTELDFTESKKVPFPELGLDVVDASTEESEKDVSTLVSDIESWEDNWRFRKKAGVSPYGNVRGRTVVCDEPVPMLIPNPEDPNTRTRIGSRDIDELSDLSEKNSDDTLDEASTSDTDSEMCYNNSRQHPEEKPVPLNNQNKDDNDVLRTPSPRPTPLPRRNRAPPPSSLPNSPPKYVAPSERSPPPRGLRVVAPPDNVMSVEEGKRAKLKCRVFSEPPYDVWWFCGLDLVQDGGKFRTYQIGQEAHLDIDNVQNTDQSTYSCVVRNKNGQAWTECKLQIRGSTPSPSIPEFIEHLKDVDLAVGDTAIFKCKVSGFPEPQMKWFYEAEEVVPGPCVNIVRNGDGNWSLEMNSLTNLASGSEVMVVASNRLGQSTSSCYLNIVENTKSEVRVLTKKVNSTQDDVHVEAEKMLVSANQSAASSALRKITGQALDIVSTAEIVLEEDASSNSAHPIAEREHRKWLHPTATIPNNPYTPENLEKRAKTNRNYLTRSNALPPRQLEDETDGNDKTSLDLSRSVDGETARENVAGNTNIDSKEYRRDYFVNDENPMQLVYARQIHIEPVEGFESETRDSLNSVEEKMYVTAGKMSSLEEKVTNLETQVQQVAEDTSTRRMCDLEDRVVHAAAQITHNEKQLSVVETQVNRLQKEINQRRIQRSFSDRASTRDWSSKPINRSSNLLSPSDESETNEWLSVEKSELRATSLERLNTEGGGLNRQQLSSSIYRAVPLSRKFSTSVSCLYRPPNSDTVFVSSHNVRDEVPNLPSVKELVNRFQEGLASGSSSQLSSLERKNVISVVDIVPQDSVDQSPVMEARNVVIVDKNSSSRGTGKREVTEQQIPTLLVQGSPPQSPNVRELTRKFSEEANEESGPDSATVKRVHSLTARSLSKEFREAVQRNFPRNQSHLQPVTINTNIINNTTTNNYNKEPQLSDSSPISPSSPDAPNFWPRSRTSILFPHQTNGNGDRQSPDTDGHGYTSDESAASSVSTGGRWTTFH